MPPGEFATSSIEYYTTHGIRHAKFETLAGRRGSARRLTAAETADVVRDLFGYSYSLRMGRSTILPNDDKKDDCDRAARLHAFLNEAAHHDAYAKSIAAEAYGNHAAACMDATGLSVLADKLDDLGCPDEEVLNHLRSPKPHYPGCWALDLVMGRSW